ncbi:MAG: cyclic nucleotide-binding domain-containing protein [Desulfobacterales bacterium]
MSIGLAFSGSLDFLSLGELVQIIGNNGGTGVLRLMSKYAPSPGLIYISKGDPVDAVNAELTGLEALFSLFGWTQGEFSFSQEPVDHQNVINKNRMEIILDGSRMVDDGKVPVLGPVSYREDSGTAGGERDLPLIKGPFVDYMYVVDEEEFYEGDEIVIEGNYGNWMWVVLEGIVEISKQTAAGPLKILRLSDGAYVGSISSFLTESSVRRTTARALSRVQLGMLDSHLLANEYAAMSPELREVVKSLDKRLNQVTDQLARIHAHEEKADRFLRDKRPVIDQGQNEQRVFAITRGRAAIGRKTETGLVPLVELAKGDFFGHIPFLKMGHEPHAAAVFASADLKISPLDAGVLVAEYEGLPNSFRHIIENLATCISVTTMMACEHHKNLHPETA